MKRDLLLTSFLALAAIYPSVRAQLPGLDQKEWLGHFAAYESKRFNFGITSMGRMTLVPMNEKGAPVGNQMRIDIDASVEEVLPSGKTSFKKIKPETLSSQDKVTGKLEKTTIRGMVTGDAAFEMVVTQDHGVISLGGKVTDAGTLTKNPLRFVVRVKIPNAYTYEKTSDKRSQKAFEKKVGDDRIDIKWTDGKKLKQTLEKEVDATSKDLNGPGIAAAQIDIAGYKGRRFLFTASENSSFTLWNPNPQPLYKGFSINWTADAEKDKEGKGRLAIEVK